MNQTTDFPLIDYHVHFTEAFPIESAVRLADEKGVKFGIVEHPGPRFAIQTDDDLAHYIETVRRYPVYLGLQPMIRNWTQYFSPALVEKVDYILMDADILPLDNGQTMRLWEHDLFVEDVDEFMDHYMAHIEAILREEPITIFAKPTYLPVNLGRFYDRVWTPDRVDRMIALAAERSIAFEISPSMMVPSKKIILKAKAAGIKFTFGTNARNQTAGNLRYALQMVQECGLCKENMLVL